MKKIILLAGIMLLAGTAQAQMVGGGGSIGSSAAINAPDSIASNTGVAPAPHPNVSATNPGEFVPSTFESYQQAVAAGQEELDAQPLRLADVARMYQARKKLEIQKPALIAEQDDDGNVIISSERRRAPGKSN